MDTLQMEMKFQSHEVNWVSGLKIQMLLQRLIKHYGPGLTRRVLREDKRFVKRSLMMIDYASRLFSSLDLTDKYCGKNRRKLTKEVEILGLHTNYCLE
mmetsp:Transcript_18643/g.28301  ORF Transcript_18643/g.28301 Transcript_18643/m.28301 type:complete len:98 (+) Transcript_18643:3491-3784(+)